MTRYNNSKLNHLITKSANGHVLTSEWLKKQGIDFRLVWWYVQSGWLEQLSNKIYKKGGDKITWVSALVALQQQLNLPIHIGSKTALQLLGKAHYLPLADLYSVDLFTISGTAIPRWFLKEKLWGLEFRINKTNLFNLTKNKKLGLTLQEINGLQVQLAGPERALFEVFCQVPKKISYEESLQLMENLPYLRPKLVQELLQACSSIKTKRLFLHAAEKFQHEWFAHLNLKKIDLGRGKSKIGVGGSYDTKYKLSVPILKEPL